MSDPSADTSWRPRWLGLIMILYCAPVVAALRPITDPDIWWHLRTGQWIVEHRAVPWTDPSFSTYGRDTLWIAYSWLVEIALYGLYRVFGLVGPLVYSTTLALAVAVMLHVLMLAHDRRIPRATALTALLLGGMATAFAPRTYLASILLLTIELYILLSVRQHGKVSILFFIPPLFVLWANIHIQFVYGLLVLALCLAESVIVRVYKTDAIDASRSIPVRPMVVVALASCLATVVNPYHVYLHWAVLETIRQTGVWQWVIDLRAMEFRQPADWLVLGWALGAAFILGRQRRVQLFPALFFAAAVFVSFRARRDVWLVVLASGVVVALGSPRVGLRGSWLTWRRGFAVAAVVTGATVIVASARNVSPDGLERAIAREFPAQAAAVIEANAYRGPLFNPYDWGGYLMWRLPTLQVSMDPRGGVHGDARIARSLQTWGGEKSWASDPELRRAQLVIGPTYIALTSLLRLDPRFVLLYEDDVATVFVARSAVPSQP